MKNIKSTSKEVKDPFPEAQLLENNGNEQIAYDSVVIPPLNMSVFGSKLSLKIIKELVREPGCAMDVARSLGEHEQKIYYHMRRLEKAGVVRLKSKEKRYGMTAKIFGVVSPVIATKLYDGGRTVKTSYALRNPRAEKFFYPFIDQGEFNCLVILGYPYSHGKFDKGAKEGAHIFYLSLILGNLINNLDFEDKYKFDTMLKNADLKNNLILIGNPQTNIIIDRINKKLPVYFDEKGGAIVSRQTGNTYNDPRIGIIIKTDNPFKKGKKLLILAGQTRGTKAAVLGCTKYLKDLITKDSDTDSIVKIVKGFDRTGDNIIDSVKIVE